MQIPTETKRFTQIAAILYAAAVVLQCLLICFRQFVAFGRSSEELSGGAFALLLIEVLLHLPLTVLLFWKCSQKSVTRSHSILTAILAPVFYFGSSLLLFVIVRIGYYFTSASVIGSYSIVSSQISLLNPLYVVGFILLCCTVAIEFYLLKHTPSDGD